MIKALDSERPRGQCKFHKRCCPIELPETLDTMIIGFPCAPYSAARTSRWQTGSLKIKHNT
eukprot:1486105-Amphidinium_carterae.3